MHKSKRLVPKILAFRPAELTPLIQLFLDRNPGVKLTDLQRRGIKLALKEFAGKKHAHLVEDSKNFCPAA